MKNEILSKAIFFGFLAFFSSMQHCGYSQLATPWPLFQSPNAAGLGKYGSIDVSPFTGLADIGVEVFSLQEGDIPVKCRLRYNSGGVRPADHPGWVGQNWTLDVGGIVTRQVNGGVDEAMISDNTPNSPNTYAYYYHYGDLSDLNRSETWLTSSFINNWWPNNSGSPPVIPILAPDKFVFNLPNGNSGSFYLNHLGQWVVASKSGDDLTVNVQVNSSPIHLYKIDPASEDSTTTSLQVQRAFYKITITDQLGFVYTFGNTDDAIEFTRSSRMPNGNYTNNSDVIANAWHLTTVSSPKGNSVSFSYGRRLNQYVQLSIYPSATSYYSNFAGNFLAQTFSSGQTTSLQTDFVQVITPSYLKKITGSSFNVNFTAAPTNELQYTYRCLGITNLLGGFESVNFQDLGLQDQTNPNDPSYGAPLSMWYKLTDIAVSDMYGNVKQKYAFDYLDTPASRLFLTAFRKVSLATDPDIKYSFTYNQTALPNYNVLALDQWGYSNGKTFLVPIPTNDDVLFSDYLSMDPALAQGGILTSLQYPTGGYTTFEYQPNDYSQVVQKQGTTIALAAQTGIGGGLRIYRVTDYDANGNSYPVQYQYIKTATGQSSGILGGMKEFHYSVTLQSPDGSSTAGASFYDMNTFNNLSYTDGKEVVYSEVKKILPDNSYTVFTYTNSDSENGLDESPAYIYTDGWAGNLGYSSSTALSSSHPFLAFCSHELERGLLTSKTDYSATGQVVHQVTNTYNSDPARFNQFVRMYDNYTFGVNSDQTTVDERYFQAVKIYTYYPYLQSRTEVDFDQVTGAAMTTASTYAYGLPAHRQLVEVDSQNSDGAPLSTQNIYGVDIINGTKTISGLGQDQITTLTNAYNSKGMNLPVQISKFYNSTLVSTEQRNYNSSFLPSAYLASTWSNSLEVRIQYPLYDAKGNMLVVNKAQDIFNSFLYGYKSQLPIAKVLNADQADIAYTSFEDLSPSTAQGNWILSGAPQPDPGCPFGGYSFALTPGTNYVQATGLTSTKMYTVSYWSKNGAYTVTGSQSFSTGISSNGWTFYQHSVTGVTTVTITGSGSLDELKLYPVGSEMTTYTYNPLFGMTSETDPNNVTNFYEHDSFGRLINMRDRQHRILKTYKYNYKKSTGN